MKNDSSRLRRRDGTLRMLKRGLLDGTFAAIGSYAPCCSINPLPATSAWLLSGPVVLCELQQWLWVLLQDIGFHSFVVRYGVNADAQATAYLVLIWVVLCDALRMSPVCPTCDEDSTFGLLGWKGW
ncbi:unnamed protein product [Effrenium voratum]|nr:unnamed protein product [Effrenium voratum]